MDLSSGFKTDLNMQIVHRSMFAQVIWIHLPFSFLYNDDKITLARLLSFAGNVQDQAISGGQSFSVALLALHTW